VRSWSANDLLGLATHDRRDAELEILNRFDWALLLHCAPLLRICCEMDLKLVSPLAARTGVEPVYQP
jgi:hypothetical protein